MFGGESGGFARRGPGFIENTVAYREQVARPPHGRGSNTPGLDYRHPIFPDILGGAANLVLGAEGVKLAIVVVETWGLSRFYLGGGSTIRPYCIAIKLTLRLVGHASRKKKR